MKTLAYIFTVCISLPLFAVEIGSFAIKRELTSSKLIFPDKVVIDRFEDPKVKGVSCYVSSVSTGGVTGAVGLATDPSDVGISCVKTGKLIIGDVSKDKSGEVVFSDKQAIFFKTFKVRRFFDPTAKALIYVGYTDKAILDGSKKTSIFSIPMD